MSEKRNILFIHTDSMDGRLLGMMGHPAMKNATPNLDRLAQQGVMFKNAYCNNPICCPSRSSMWSGLFTHHCEGWNNYKGLEPGTPTLRTNLEEGGYLTKTFGKEDYLSGAHTQRARVTAWTRSAGINRPEYSMPAPCIVDNYESEVHEKDWEDVHRSGQWLKDYADHKMGHAPFWLYVGIRMPHPPFKINRKYLEMVDESAIDIPPKDESHHPVMEYQKITKNWSHGTNPETVKKVRHIYFAMIAEVDAMFGKIMEYLDMNGLRKNTYVVFSSDHGELAMEHDQNYKMNPYEPSVRVPLIISGPDIQPAQIENPVSLVDIYPTFMDMTGLDKPENLDGHSLVPFLTAKSKNLTPSNHAGWVLSECHDSSCLTGWFMLRRGKWKYIAHPGFESQLFNLDNDPWEIDNQVTQQPEVAREMDQLLKSVVDYESVDKKVKAYDRKSFREWREEHKAAGDYNDWMSKIFSGNQDDGSSDITPWSPENEKQIEEWLEMI